MSDPKETPDPGSEDAAEIDSAVEEAGADEGDEDQAEPDETEDDGEPDETEDADDDGESGDEPEKPRGRGASERIRELNRRARDAERERDDLRSRASQPVDRAAQQRAYDEEQARQLQAAKDAEGMGDTGAVARYYYQRGQNESANRQQWNANQAFEREDKRDFREVCRSDGISKKLSDYVEGVIQTARANGNFLATREMVLNVRLGQLARERKGQQLEKQRDRGERKIIRQTVKAPRGGSDAQSTRLPRDQSKWTTEQWEQYLGSRRIG